MVSNDNIIENLSKVYKIQITGPADKIEGIKISKLSYKAGFKNT